MKKKKSPGRPAYYESINGKELKKNIFNKFHSQEVMLRRCELDYNERISRSWLSECITANKMTFIQLDLICKVLDHAPEYYMQNVNCGKVQTEAGKEPEIPSYMFHLRYLSTLQFKELFNNALAFAGVESEAERNRIINTPEALIDFAEEVRKAADKWK